MGGSGNDTIIKYGSENISINAGDGDDTIITGSVLNNPGKDPQYYNLVSNATVRGGSGNDYIENRGGKNITFVYNDGDNNDTIYGL